MRRRDCMLALAALAPPAASAETSRHALRLAQRSDRENFRLWFTFLAEWTAFAARPPREVADCSALLRFAAREALREHTGAWMSELGLPGPAPFPDVRQYRYPRTPVGANLFATATGEYRQFADARTLMRFNAHPLAVPVTLARPGDLLFFRQWTDHQPFHSMVVLGRSHFDGHAGPLVVYHTGPVGRDTGEIRRPSIEELKHHPNPQWRPLEGNANFLGVFRWNLLEESE